MSEYEHAVLWIIGGSIVLATIILIFTFFDSRGN